MFKRFLTLAMMLSTCSLLSAKSEGNQTVEARYEFTSATQTSPVTWNVLYTRASGKGCPCTITGTLVVKTLCGTDQAGTKWQANISLPIPFNKPCKNKPIIVGTITSDDTEMFNVAMNVSRADIISSAVSPNGFTATEILQFETCGYIVTLPITVVANAVVAHLENMAFNCGFSFIANCVCN